MRAPVLPSARLLIAVIICLVSAMLCTWLVRQPPWLGLGFEQTSAGATLRLASVDAIDATTGAQAGDSLMAIAALGGQPMSVEPRDLLEEPDFLDTWAEERTFYARQSQLTDILHAPAVSLTLLGWIAMVLIAGMAQGASAFWLAANIAGLCMGASQAAGRAIVGVLAPPARLGEFFGLWGLAVKLASIFGPLSYGLMTWVFGGDHRTAIMVLGVYFAIGLVILRGVDMKRGRAAALGG